MNEDEVCKKCKGIGAVDDFFQNRVEVPKNPKQNQREDSRTRDVRGYLYHAFEKVSKVPLERTRRENNITVDRFRG